MIANRRANLMWQDRRDRLGRAFRRDGADCQDLGRWTNDGGKRGQYFGVDARIFRVIHSMFLSIYW